MLVDSHCHLDRVSLKPYAGSFAAMMEATIAAGVGHMLCVSIDLERYSKMRSLVEPYAQVSVSVGVHPNEPHRRDPTPEELVELAADPRNVAIGETGLDYFRSEGDVGWQQQRFRNHITAARACAKPLIVHSRDARDDTIAILREERAQDAGGVLHCFTESWEMACQALDLGFYISFSGILTFRTAEDLREVARRLPMDRILIETDCPYLTPMPHRGRPNEPRFVSHVAACLGEIRDMDPTEVALVTRDNFFRLFPSAVAHADPEIGQDRQGSSG